jgi:hypothetical protein
MNFLAIRVYGICLLGKWKGGFFRGFSGGFFCGVWRSNGDVLLNFQKRKTRFFKQKAKIGAKLENFKEINKFLEFTEIFLRILKLKESFLGALALFINYI